MDWSTFTIKQPVKASKEDIEKLFSTSEGLEKWFLRSANFKNFENKEIAKTEKLVAGNTYHWLWHGYPDEIFEEGKILEPKKDEIIRFVFGTAGTVAVKIILENGETIIELTQSEIPTDENSKINFHAGCKSGWTFYLLNLKSILEFGNDLRKKNAALHLD